MKYIYSTIYEATKTTCGEQVQRYPYKAVASMFILEPGEEPITLHNSWDWIQHQQPNNFIWLLGEVDQGGSF